MSEALEVARELFDQSSRVRDPRGREVDLLDPETLAVLFDFFAPEVEIHEDPSFPEAGVYRGKDAIREYMSQFTESFDSFSFEAEDFIDLGDDRVLILFRLRSRGTESGAAVEARPGWIFTIRARKVLRMEAYLDRGEAFAAAGLETR
jgi:ketosteroid isomerase-like protein